MSPSVTQKSCEERLRKQIDGYQASAIIYAAVKLSLPDRMGSRPWTAEELAKEMSSSTPHLLRLLRALSVLGICEELRNRNFVLSDIGAYLKSDSPSCLREKAIIVVEQYWQPWANLAHSLQTGKTAFGHVFGMPPWEWRHLHVDQGATFNAWLAKETIAQAHSILEALDLSGITTVADIGGGSGGFIAAILRAYPHLRGILFDQRSTVDKAKPFLSSIGIDARVQLVSGDFFAEIPVKADLYLLKSVLHDWDDADSRAVLRNLRQAMPASAKLLIVERLLPKRAAEDETAIMIDMHMMVVTGGRERDRQEFESLLSREGFTLVRVITTRSGFSVIEAIPS